MSNCTCEIDGETCWHCFGSAMSEHRYEKRENCFNNYIPTILALGAKKLTEGVYRVGDYDLYPYKAGARNYKTGKRMYINKAISIIRNSKGIK
ncbi:hypothetical protein ACFX5K_01235 [Rickettsiales bacterium LUAb2]